MRCKRSAHAADELRRCGGQAVDAAEAEMAEAFLRGEVTGRPPSAPATADAGRHIVPFAEVLPSLRAVAVAAGRAQRALWPPHRALCRGAPRPACGGCGSWPGAACPLAATSCPLPRCSPPCVQWLWQLAGRSVPFGRHIVPFAEVLPLPACSGCGSWPCAACPVQR